MTKQKLVVAEKTRINKKLVKSNQKKAVKKRKQVTAKPANDTDNKLVKHNIFKKPLDLSIPFTGIEKTGLSARLNPKNQIQNANIFISENKRKTRVVQIDGRLLMSPEPEVEKRKSADGAGIVINFKP